MPTRHMSLTRFNTQEIADILKNRFGGMLHDGAHPYEESACALELLSVVQGQPWSGDPAQVRCFDLRWLNDTHVSPSVRAANILPVLVAYQGSLDWPMERQQRVVERLEWFTVERLLPAFPKTKQAVIHACRTSDTLSAANRAAWVSAWAAEAATLAREAAGRAAEAAGFSADEAIHAGDIAGEDLFVEACTLWLHAATA